MMSKKFRFIFMRPITCYGEVITEDTVIAEDYNKALTILKREHHFAKVKEVEVSEIELYSNNARRVSLYGATSTMITGRILNADVD